jgi:ketosteroid isomerase-like protein
MASLAPSDAHIRVVRRYLAALHAGDSAAIVRLFSPAGEVVSPFLGRVPAEEFFAKLAAASRRSDIEVLDVLIGTSEAPRAAAYLRYHWTLRDGTVVAFDCCDIFDFAHELAQESEPLIHCLTIFYDTAPLRAEVADNFAVTTADEPAG